MSKKCPEGKRWDKKTQSCKWKRSKQKLGNEEYSKKKIVYKKQKDSPYVEYKIKEKGKTTHTGTAVRYSKKRSMLATQIEK